MTLNIKQQLENSRKELLNLGLRNPLINYRPSKARGLQITNELSVELFRILVREGKRMSFLPSANVIDGEEDSPSEQESHHGIDTHAGYTDHQIQTTHPESKLQARLLNTYRVSRSFIEEQGVNTLFLAIGMLAWTESESSSERKKAPLILIPVELERASRDRFFVRYYGEEIGTNISLAAKLDIEFGLILPEIYDLDDFDVPTYFDRVEQAIVNMKEWAIERDSIALGFFSFGKFLMFRDLSEDAWKNSDSLYNHSIIKALFQSGFDNYDTPIGEGEHLDKHLKPLDILQVVDADSSQMRAIWSVNQGNNLVIQGPPGGGKSQTITNLIADAIGKGKKVLFVAEKKAALEVVMRRLNTVGIGDACLELHGQKTNKKSLLAELSRTLSLDKPLATQLDSDAVRLEGIRDRLNDYCEAVNSEIRSSGITPYNAYGNLIIIRENCKGERLPQLSIPDITEWSEVEFQHKTELIAQMQARLLTVGTPGKHPFFGSDLRFIMPSELERLDETCIRAWQANERLRESANALAILLGLPEPQFRIEVDIIYRAAQRAIEAPKLEGVRINTGDWQARSDDIRDLLQTGSALAAIIEQYDSVLIPDAWDQDLLETRQHLFNYGGKWWRFLSSNYRNARNHFDGICRVEAPKAVEKKIEIVDAILEVRKLRKNFIQKQELGALLFGAQWQSEKSDWKVLAMLFNWIISLYRDIGNGQIHEGIITFLEGNPNIIGLGEKIGNIQKALANHYDNVRKIVENINLDEDKRFGIGNKIEDLSLLQQGEILTIWSETLPQLMDIASYNVMTDMLVKEGLDSLIPTIDTWEQSPQFLTLAFKQSRYDKLLENAYKERPSLQQFDGDIQLQTINKYKDLDHAFINNTRKYLALEHWKRLPRHQAGGQLGVLNKEMQKKARHLPIRKLMRAAGNAIQAIKPVFMMSPLSIANFLSPGSLYFDLVIFDEASQVRPVEALGAIVRGKQIVVVGDSKQMPPTNFFESLIQGDEDEEEEESSTRDIESILGFCLAQGMPEQMLRWHYRSRHESLIAVSNHEFYDNRLIVFPSPDHERGEKGLVLRYHPETIYERGKSQTNPKEAQIIAKAVMAFALEQIQKNKNDRLTLLVAAFSVAQMKAILDQLEILRKQDGSCEEFFTQDTVEPFDVKNLETVQGDERDTIFISIGYGRDESGQVSMNFGPLNRDGGERRLNVLISRARIRCEVFANITDEDISLSRTNSRGVKSLKSFLAYARNGRLGTTALTGRDTDSPFEDQVKTKLELHGYEVHAQVGCAGYFIDLAVVDPDKPGRYLLGVECDGAMYHSSRAARDRDRLRQEVLEGLGWKIHRIWSTDWFKFSEKESNRLFDAIDKVKLSSQHSNVSTSLKRYDIDIQRVQADSFNSVKMITNTTEYRVWNKLIELKGKAFHETPIGEIATMVSDLVEVEGPIHFNEIARRLTMNAGLGKIGSRIRVSIEKACRFAVNYGMVKQSGEFLWPKITRPLEIRDRSTLPPASRKLELISREEIAFAVEKIVASSLGIERDEVIINVLRLFGFSKTSDDQKITIDMEITNLISKNRLIQNDGHLVLTDKWEEMQHPAAQNIDQSLICKIISSQSHEELDDLTIQDIE